MSKEKTKSDASIADLLSQISKLKILSPREELVVRLRDGMGGKGLRYGEITRRFAEDPDSPSPEALRRIHSKALEKLADLEIYKYYASCAEKAKDASSIDRKALGMILRSFVGLGDKQARTIVDLMGSAQNLVDACKKDPLLKVLKGLLHMKDHTRLTLYDVVTHHREYETSTVAEASQRTKASKINAALRGDFGWIRKSPREIYSQSTGKEVAENAFKLALRYVSALNSEQQAKLFGMLRADGAKKA